MLHTETVEQGTLGLLRQDICAMKLGAISSRAEKKDFYDLFFLLKEFRFSEMLEFYHVKFSTDDVFNVVKSAAYFTDADNSPEPNLLEEVSWEEVKRAIRSEVSSHLK